MKTTDHALEHLNPSEALDVEDSLWWVEGRKRIIHRWLTRMGGGGAMGEIFDVGCGSGGNLATLASFGRVSGIEVSDKLAAMARRRGIAAEVKTGDLRGLGMGVPADVLTLFDVLEHIEDEQGFLADVRALGRPGHELLVSVPACPALFSRHDVLLQHHRRYSRPQLCEVLGRAGYVVQDCRYFMTFLFPLAVAARAWEGLRSLCGRPSDKINIGHVTGVAGTLMQKALAAEARAGFAVRFPVGLWLFAWARSAEAAGCAPS